MKPFLSSTTVDACVEFLPLDTVREREGDASVMMTSGI